MRVAGRADSGSIAHARSRNLSDPLEDAARSGPNVAASTVTG